MGAFFQRDDLVQCCGGARFTRVIDGVLAVYVNADPLCCRDFQVIKTGVFIDRFAE